MFHSAAFRSTFLGLTKDHPIRSKRDFASLCNFPHFKATHAIHGLDGEIHPISVQLVLKFATITPPGTSCSAFY